MPFEADYKYIDILSSLKDKIRLARQKAVLSVNAHLLQIYWEIGQAIVHQQKEEGWGSKVIERLATDLKLEFPDMKGLSVRNLNYMRSFAEAYPELIILQQPAAKFQTEDNQIITSFMQQPAAQIPWAHHQVILDKVKDIEARKFYIHKTVENGWSRNILTEQINRHLHQRAGNAITNFHQTLPAPVSDLAKETLKSPFNFDFITMSEKMQERDLEKSLIEHLKNFMRELGRGFAYVGNQYNLNVMGDDYFLDLLFYNTRLHCYIIFELKLGEFKPEFAGKLNFYINAVDEQIKMPEDKPTIGVLLCKTPNKTVVKYALQGIESPMGVSEYELSKAIPELKREMPTIDEFEEELQKEIEELKSPAKKKLDALRNRIAKLSKEEVQTSVTDNILLNTHKNSIIPLFQKMISVLDELKNLFLSTDYFFSGPNNLVNIEDMNKYWGDIHFLKLNNEQYFKYNFKGFIRGGTDTFNTSVTIYYIHDTYWYGFRLVNFKNQAVFFKKLYPLQLEHKEIDSICDTVLEKLTDDIQLQIEQLE